MVKLKVRKAGPFSKRGSRWPGIKGKSGYPLHYE